MKPKGRPVKLRKVAKEPRIAVFSPRGKPGRPDEVNLKYEELEAIRLADLNGMRHKEASSHMGVSRQSFGRVLKRARKTAAEGLVSGKIIRVTGGSYKLAPGSRAETKKS